MFVISVMKGNRFAILMTKGTKLSALDMLARLVLIIFGHI